MFDEDNEREIKQDELVVRFTLWFIAVFLGYLFYHIIRYAVTMHG